MRSDPLWSRRTFAGYLTFPPGNTRHPKGRRYGTHAVITQTLRRGVRTAHWTSASFLAAAIPGAQPSPHAPVRACALQYHSADAAVGTSEMATSARDEKMIIRMEFKPFDSENEIVVGIRITRSSFSYERQRKTDIGIRRAAEN